MAKKWPGMVVQRSFIKGHSFPIGLYMNTVKKRIFSSDMILCLISAILRKIVLHSYKSVRPNDFAFYYLSIWIVWIWIYSSHFQVAPLPRNPNGNGKLESNMLSSIAAAS